MAPPRGQWSHGRARRRGAGTKEEAQRTLRNWAQEGLRKITTFPRGLRGLKRVERGAGNPRARPGQRPPLNSDSQGAQLPAAARAFGRRRWALLEPQLTQRTRFPRVPPRKSPAGRSARAPRRGGRGGRPDFWVLLVFVFLLRFCSVGLCGCSPRPERHGGGVAASPGAHGIEQAA